MEFQISDPATLGRLIRDNRKVSGLTQTDLAGLCGVSMKFVNQVENGKETAEIGKILRLVGTVGVDLIARTRGVSE